MTTSKISRMGSVAAEVLIAQTLVGGVVAAFAQGLEEIGQASTALDKAKGAQLPRVLASLEGITKDLTGEQWDRDYKPALVNGLEGAGVAKLRATVLASETKVIALAKSNGFVPAAKALEATTVKAFADFARQYCYGHKVMVAPAPKTPANPGKGRPAKGETAQGVIGKSKSKPVELPTDVEAAMVLTRGDEPFALLMVALCSSDEGLDRLAAFVVEAAQPSPGRKSRIG